VATGTADLDFGAFPGKSDASVAVTGQAAIVAGSLVEAWIRPVDTADHLADEHIVDPPRVVAANIVAGTGFTIYGWNPDKNIGGQKSDRTGGGGDTLIYGVWKIAWAWV
jgi:hypothetical protein